MTDIFNGIHELCQGFVAAGLDPPAAIDLASRKDGTKLIRSLAGVDGVFDFQLTPNTPYAMPIKGADGKLWVELSQTFYGIKIRWPAK